MARHLTSTQPEVHFLSYANDITIFSRNSHPKTAATQLQEYIYILEQWRTNTPTTRETYDTGMTCKQHYKINTKAKTRLNVLRVLTNTYFDHSKEDIARVYKRYIRPLFSYAHPTRQPDTSDTQLQKLQITQNTAL